MVAPWRAIEQVPRMPDPEQEAAPSPTNAHEPAAYVPAWAAGPDPGDSATVIVTGGAGFAGVNLVRHVLAATAWRVVSYDLLTYAANPESQKAVADDRHLLVRGDVRDAAAFRALLEREQPHAVIHLAAESHVDRSIDGPLEFVDTNVSGTAAVLQESLRYWKGCAPEAAGRFRLVHVSTDEVFGSVEPGAAPLDECAPFRPTSPYSASKAAADHLVSAWQATYGLPAVTIHPSNLYGPFQFAEKLIPLMIERWLRGESLPVYGTGENERDWLHAADLAELLVHATARARPGARYCVNGREPRTNLAVVRQLCDLLDEMHPGPGGGHAGRIEFVQDRPGHDLRYAMDSSRVERELGWRPRRRFNESLREVVRWYLENEAWRAASLASGYRQQRLGLDGVGGGGGGGGGGA